MQQHIKSYSGRDFMFGIQEKETYEKDGAYGFGLRSSLQPVTVCYKIDFTGK